MPIALTPVAFRAYAVRPVVTKPVVFDNYQTDGGTGGGPNGIFMYYEELLHRITNIRLPKHLGV